MNQLRTIRSFVKREGRFSAKRKQSFETLWLQYGLDFIDEDTTKNRLLEHIKNYESTIVDIGFGSGESLAQHALQNPQTLFIGIEVHKPGVETLFRVLKTNNVNNVLVFCADALEVLEVYIQDNSLAALQLYFPDPWPKKKHHKRRIVNQQWLNIVERKLKADGILHIATDWAEYANWIKNEIEANPRYEPICFTDRRNRVITRFEQKGIDKGHSITEIVTKPLQKL